MICTDIPRILEEKPHRRACERLAELFPDCQCEHHSVCPDLSPGPVQNNEILARLIPAKDFDPVTNMVRPSLFEKASENGMSVTRLGAQGSQAPEQQEPGKFIGFVTSLCQDIRSALHDGKRAFAVYDTAIDSNVYHADVCQTVCYPNSLGIKIRRQLQEAFSRTICRFEEVGADGSTSDDTPPNPG